MKSAVSSKKDALAPFVILMTAYLSLNSVLNLSNKYALVSLHPRLSPGVERLGSLRCASCEMSGGDIARSEFEREEKCV